LSSRATWVVSFFEIGFSSPAMAGHFASALLLIAGAAS
jgi:hypothetical protein